MTTDSLKTLRIGGLPMIVGGLEDAADWMICRALLQDATTIVAHANVHNYYLATRDEHACADIETHYHLLFDGIGMKVGAAVLGLGWQEDICGTDLAPLVLARLAAAGLSVYFLGARNDIVRSAVERSRIAFPGLDVAGSHHGYFTGEEEPAVVQEIRRSGARVLIVSMGSGMQERFILRHRGRLGVSLVWNVGGLFDTLSGAKRRAPLLMRRIELEWLYRLLLEPRRMARRNFVEGPWFLAHIFAQRIALAHERSGQPTRQ